MPILTALICSNGELELMNNNRLKDNHLVNLFTHVQTLMSKTEPQRAGRSYYVNWKSRSCYLHTITPPRMDMISPVIQYRALQGITEGGYIVYISDRRSGCTCSDYQSSGGNNGPCKHMYSIMVLFVDWYIGAAPAGRFKYQLLIAYTDTETNTNLIHTELFNSKSEASEGLNNWSDTTEGKFMILSYDIKAFYYGNEPPVIVWGRNNPLETNSAPLEGGDNSAPEPDENSQIETVLDYLSGPNNTGGE